MATINVQDVAKAVNTYLATNKKVVSADFGQALKTTLDAYAKKVTKVKGQYPQFHMILSHVVQGFRPQWDELGKANLQSKILKNYQQKVNFPVIPAEILNTYLADLYEEGKPITNKEIAKMIFKDVLAKIKDDVEYLSIRGEYNATNAYGQFGYSMDGISKVIDTIYADTTHPAYKVPLNALTDTNIVDEITKFERKVPAYVKNKVKKIFLSENNFERYVLRYEELYGQNTDYKATSKMKTRLGKRELVALPGLPDDKVFATIDGNLLKLVDIIDNPPAFTDVQVQDYKIKLFAEFWLGYDFAINEAVFVSNFTDTAEGLGDPAKEALYFPHK